MSATREPWSDADEVLLALDRWTASERAFVAVVRLANERGMTWREIAALTGIPRATLNRWSQQEETKP
jgi:DNA-directed RNA polymerase specialized sigma24 family protein